MTEELAVAFNDVDYCLKVRKHGWLVVAVCMMHHTTNRVEKLPRIPRKVRAL